MLLCVGWTGLMALLSLPRPASGVEEGTYACGVRQSSVIWLGYCSLRVLLMLPAKS